MHDGCAPGRGGVRDGFVLQIGRGMQHRAKHVSCSRAVVLSVTCNLTHHVEDDTQLTAIAHIASPSCDADATPCINAGVACPGDFPFVCPALSVHKSREWLIKCALPSTTLLQLFRPEQKSSLLIASFLPSLAARSATFDVSARSLPSASSFRGAYAFFLLQVLLSTTLPVFWPSVAVAATPAASSALRLHVSVAATGSDAAAAVAAALGGWLRNATFRPAPVAAALGANSTSAASVVLVSAPVVTPPAVSPPPLTWKQLRQQIASVRRRLPPASLPLTSVSYERQTRPTSLTPFSSPVTAGRTRGDSANERSQRDWRSDCHQPGQGRDPPGHLRRPRRRPLYPRRPRRQPALCPQHQRPPHPGEPPPRRGRLRGGGVHQQRGERGLRVGWGPDGPGARSLRP